MFEPRDPWLNLALPAFPCHSDLMFAVRKCSPPAAAVSPHFRTGRPWPQPSSATERPAMAGAAGFSARYACENMWLDAACHRLMVSTTTCGGRTVLAACVGMAWRRDRGRRHGVSMSSVARARATRHKIHCALPELQTPWVKGGGGRRATVSCVFWKQHSCVSSAACKHDAARSLRADERLTFVLPSDEIGAADVLAQVSRCPGDGRAVSLQSHELRHHPCQLGQSRIARLLRGRTRRWCSGRWLMLDSKRIRAGVRRVGEVREGDRWRRGGRRLLT